MAAHGAGKVSVGLLGLWLAWGAPGWTATMKPADPGASQAGSSGAGGEAAGGGGVYEQGVFELGDGVQPPAPGLADILGASQAGPDWNDLFKGDRTPRDVIDEFGNPGSNGVPDYFDTWGIFRTRRDASFIFDDVSAGTATDATALLGPGEVGPGVVDPAHDLGNAYAYVANDALQQRILYFGAERLGNAESSLTVELNRLSFALQDGHIIGERSVGDVQVRAAFASGILSALEVWAWLPGWVLVEVLPLDPSQPAEQCNAGSSLCAVCNGVTVDGGAWPNYDVSGGSAPSLLPDTFLEVGLNLSQLLGTSLDYTTLQLTTPEDYALSGFERLVVLQAATEDACDLAAVCEDNGF
jgi:hypothetical protein